MKKKTLLAVIAAAAMSLALLSACSGGSTASSSAASDSSSSSQASSSASSSSDSSAAAASDQIVVDSAAKTVTIPVTATGKTDGSIHVLGNADGSNASKDYFTTTVTAQEVYDALESLGATHGDNIALDAADGTIEGSDLDITVTFGGKDYAIEDLIEDSGDRALQARFGGNVDANTQAGTGCIFCMESCSLGITSNAAYQYKEKATFTPTDAMPEKGTEATFTFTVAE